MMSVTLREPSVTRFHPQDHDGDERRRVAKQQGGEQDDDLRRAGREEVED
jgi:hypothetical protein